MELSSVDQKFLEDLYSGDENAQVLSAQVATEGLVVSAQIESTFLSSSQPIEVSEEQEPVQPDDLPAELKSSRGRIIRRRVFKDFIMN